MSVVGVSSKYHTEESETVSSAVSLPGEFMDSAVLSPKSKEMGFISARLRGNSSIVLL